MRPKHVIPLIMMLLSIITLKGSAQEQTQSLPDSTGLPGDNFSLAGALEMFKKAGSPEEFEKLLNTRDNQVNNLDLNQDGTTDYIRVINKRENDVHIFVLQDLVSAKESQDIAVIELQKTGKESAVIQITGDEDIFGQETIVEPGDEPSSSWNNAGRSLAGGPSIDNENSNASASGIIVNVWVWPCVRFVYAPSYAVWVSPWSWSALPVWWHPWRPYAFVVFRPFRYHYYPHYMVVPVHRVVYARTMYRPMRVTSVTVVNRNRVAVRNYRVARTTTRTVEVNRGGRQYEATRRTTTVTGPRGRVTRRKTTWRRDR